MEEGSAAGIFRVFYDVILRPGETLRLQKGRSTWKKGLTAHLAAAAVMIFFHLHRLLYFEDGPSALVGVSAFAMAYLAYSFLQLSGVLIAHLISRLFGGRGRLVEMLWLTGTYAVPLASAAVAVGMLSNMSLWFMAINIPLLAFALCLDMIAIEEAHGLSRPKSVGAVLSSFLMKFIIFAMVAFSAYSASLMALNSGFMGLDRAVNANNVEILDVGQASDTIESGGLAFHMPGGWVADRDSKALRLFGYRYYVKGDAVIMIAEGGIISGLLPSDGQEYTGESCRSIEFGMASEPGVKAAEYVEYGLVRGCEARMPGGDGGVQIIFQGVVCEGHPITLTVVAPDDSSISSEEAVSDYLDLMESISCV
ncbi:MAG: hypothetical protein GF416_04520 [Candidatus Altiarchaeales archaeon]|nr:hypothetical protein [Candidatus Altiarchaeales archaeon]MBD3416384.1 hypothetical protein [Candidatus Altiarchaeales archaeon]